VTAFEAVPLIKPPALRGVSNSLAKRLKELRMLVIHPIRLYRFTSKNTTSRLARILIVTSPMEQNCEVISCPWLSTVFFSYEVFILLRTVLGDPAEQRCPQSDRQR